MVAGSMLDGSRRSWLVHRLAYRELVGPIGDSLVLHHCDTPPCVNPDHLYLGTYQDNHNDMWRRGRARRARGEQSGMARLTEGDVVVIRRDARRIGIREMGRRLGVSYGTVYAALVRRTWKHVAEDSNA